VDMPNPSDTLRRLYADGNIEKKEGVAFLDTQRHIRKANSQSNLDAVLFKRAVFL
jgi:hypothetical protein